MQPRVIKCGHVFNSRLKYVSKKGVTITGIQRFLKKKSTIAFDKTSVGEVICKMQQNGKIDGKFKIINPIYDDKNFAEDSFELHPKTCNDKSYISEELVDTASGNSNNDSYSATDKSFTGEYITSDDPNKTASDS